MRVRWSRSIRTKLIAAFATDIVSTMQDFARLAEESQRRASRIKKTFDGSDMDRPPAPDPGTAEIALAPAAA
jgi:hypothetical protein